MRVLIVDDFEPWRNHLCSLLKLRPHFHVCEAADGLEAVQKAQELQPDLILLDISLPKLDGIQAAKQIRAISPKSKILFVSVEGSSEFEEAALSVGAKGLIPKAEVSSKLLKAIDALSPDK